VKVAWEEREAEDADLRFRLHAREDEVLNLAQELSAALQAAGQSEVQENFDKRDNL
jgi:hypothetical protein